MKILITGASGLVGTRLIELLFEYGYDDVRVLTRDKRKFSSPFPVQVYEWDPNKRIIDDKSLLDVDIVFHLAGENVAGGRWDEKRKQQILQSRVLSTQLILDTIRKQDKVPQKFICASAVGIYGDRAGEELRAGVNLGSGMLAEVCKQWENQALSHGIQKMKSYCLRTGIVLSLRGGALKKMLPAFLAGVGGNLGDGKQYMSWIHIDDLVRQYLFIMENEVADKVYDAVSPQPLTNKEFTKTLGKTLNRPTLTPVPAIGLKLLFGEMSSILLGSQKVLPDHILKEKFVFQYLDLNSAFNQIFAQWKDGDELFVRYQWLPHQIENVFSFFTYEENLEKITPPFLNFHVVKKNVEAISKGTIIDYRLKLHGVPMRWQSEITLFQKDKVFIDEQTQGPYKKWIHKHYFFSTPGGTLIKDEIIYQVPFGSAGKLLSQSFVRNDLRKIFDYRREIIAEIFS